MEIVEQAMEPNVRILIPALNGFSLIFMLVSSGLSCFAETPDDRHTQMVYFRDAKSLHLAIGTAHSLILIAWLLFSRASYFSTSVRQMSETVLVLGLFRLALLVPMNTNMP